MDNNQGLVPLESRIGEMKKQFQKSYEIFIKANEELSKLNFDYLSLYESKENEAISDILKLDVKDVNEILCADSIDDSIEKLRSKIREDDEKFKTSFPDITKLLKIMNNLQVDIESLKEQQDQFVKLTQDVNEEMNRFEKGLEESTNYLDDLVVESINSDENGEEQEDETDSSTENDEELEDLYIDNIDSECSD